MYFSDKPIKKMGPKKPQFQRPHAGADLVAVSLACGKVMLILVSLGVVLWQGYDVTKIYLSWPISTEHQVLPLDSMPNIMLSICQSYSITNCTLPCKSGQLPVYTTNISSYTDFWNAADNVSHISSHKLQLKNLTVKFWNESDLNWQMVNISMSSRQVYPYTENNTLLCHTLQQDIRAFVPMIKFRKTGKRISQFMYISGIYP
jgi:hypothetical protein